MLCRLVVVGVVLLSPTPSAAGSRALNDFAATEDSQHHGEAVEGAAAWQFALARSLAAEGETEAALEAWRSAVELAPAEPYVRLEFGRFLGRVGRSAEARRQAAEALRLAPDDPDVLRSAADVLLGVSRQEPAALVEAKAALESLAAARPHDVATLFDLGRVLFELGRWEDAARWFERAADEQPGNRALQSYRVSALLEAKQTDRAVEVLEEVLAHDAAFLNGRLQLASLLSDRGEHRRAVEVLSSAPAGQRDDRELRWQLAGQQYRIGELEAALATVEALLAEDPERLRERILRGLILSALGRDQEAARLYESLLAERPRNLDLARQLVKLHERNDRPEAAEEVLRQLEKRLREAGETELGVQARFELLSHLWRRRAWGELIDAAEPAADDPESALHLEALIFTVEALHRSGRSERALERLTASQAIPLPRRLSEQAQILFDLGRDRAAAAVLQSLVDLDQPEALLAATRVLHGEGAYVEARPHLERILELAPDSTEALYWLGATYERSGDFRRAGEVFGRLLELDPQHAPALNYLGYMWAERGENLDRALELVRRAVAQEPDNGAYVDSLGWAHFQLGNYHQARVLLERAVRLMPDDAVVAEHLGDVYRHLGESGRARRQYRRALELDGDNREQVRQKLERLRESL